MTDASITNGEHKVLDPERDIDAKKTIFWLVLWTAILFACLYGLLHVFSFVIHEERQRKFAQPSEALLEQRSRSEQELNKAGQNPDGSRRVPIDEAMRIYTGDK